MPKDIYSFQKNGGYSYFADPVAGATDGIGVGADWNKLAAYSNPAMDELERGGSIYLSDILTEVSGVPVRFIDGTVSAPGASWGTEISSGLYKIGTNRFGFSIAGVQEVEFNSSGLLINNMTQGSVLFAGANGQISQDNSNLFWNDTDDSLKIGGWLYVGTATDAAADGDFVAGLTGASRLFFDQSAQTLSLYDSSGNEDISLDAAAASWYNGAGNFGFGTTGPDRKVDILDGSTAPQLRLTFTDGSIYVDLQSTATGFTMTGVPSSAGNYVFRFRYNDANIGSGQGVYQQTLGSVGGTEYTGQYGIDRFFETTGCFYIGTNAPAGLVFSADNSTKHWKINASGGLVTGGNFRFAHGTSALATNATEGFFHLQSCAGTPSGTPASIPTGQIPLIWDSTNNILYAYDGGWVSASGSGGTLDQAYDSGGAGAGRTITVDSGAVTLTAGGTTVGGFTVNGSRTIASAAGAVWNEVLIDADVSLSGSTNVTTATGFNMVTLQAPTITDAGTITSITNSSTLYIAGAPTGTGLTLTNPYALWVDDGNVRVDLNIILGGASVTTTSSISGSVNELTLAGASTSGSTLIINGTTTSAQFLFTQRAKSSGSGTGYLIVAGAHTGQTASAEVLDADFDFDATLQHATGAITTQRSVLFRNRTYSFVGASTITNAATVAILGAPIAGTNATITNRYALWVDDGAARFDGAVRPSFDGSVYWDLTVDSSGYLDITPSSSGSTSIRSVTSFAGLRFLGVVNQSSDASAGTYIQVNSSGGGDTFLSFNITGTSWACGIDNSDSDRFKISNSNVLGTNDYFFVETGGTVGFGTHSAIGAETVTGYITIKDSSGNSRKLAVVS